LTRLQRTIEKAGVVRKLRTLGAQEGDTVRIGKIEFNFVDEDAEGVVDEEDDLSRLA